MPLAADTVLIIIRHNEIRDLTASLMLEVCHDVQIEPHSCDIHVTLLF